MLLKQINNWEPRTLGIHEHLIRGRNGGLIRIRFEVREVNGILKGRIIAAEPVITIAAPTLQLTPHSHTETIVALLKEIAYPEAIVSPFSKKFFFTSQMTRAPSFL